MAEFPEKAYDSLAATPKGQEILRLLNERKQENEPVKDTQTAVRRGGRVSRLHSAAEAAVQNAECRMQNEGPAEAAMQNAECRMLNAECRMMA